jgi:hypothetical protein
MDYHACSVAILQPHPFCRFATPRFTHLTSSRPNRLGPSWRSLAFVALTLAVFTWGLQYKLSLYQSPHAVSRHMPAAKLLSGEERSAIPVANIDRVTSPDSIVAIATLTLAFCLLMGAKLFPGRTGRAPEFLTIAIMPGRASIATLFTRPPPRRR